LCECIRKGFGQDSLFAQDYTMSLYGEYLRYDFEDWLRIDHFVDEVVSQIKMPKQGQTHADVPGKWAVFGHCIEYYRSRKLARLINSMKL
jgi:hypothetical protein